MVRSRRHALSLHYTLLLLRHTLLAFGAAAAANSSPNIVMIIADDQGSRDIGYVESDISTPFLDSLAAEGVKLTNHYAQHSCSSSRNSLLTGRYEVNLGVQLGLLGACNLLGMPVQFDTLADHLKTGGYNTHAIGKWHLGFSKKELTPLYRGFDTFYGILPSHTDHFDYEHCFEHMVDFCGYALLDGEAPDYSAVGTYSAFTYTTRAVEVIRNASKSEKPMFLYLSYTVPHEPIQSPEMYYEKYNNIINDQRRVYAGMVSAMDEGVKNVTLALKEEGMWDNTVFIFFSDNGANVSTSASNWPLRGNKTTFWEGGIKSNAFVTSPLLGKIRQGETSGGLMHITDWLPTLAEIAGIDLEENPPLDGVSQWAMIKDGAQSSRTEILHNIDEVKEFSLARISNGTFDSRVNAAIRVGDFKLLTGDPGYPGWYPIPGERLEEYSYPDFTNKTIWLYDISQDPNELEDLSERMPEKVRELLDRLLYYDTNAEPTKPTEYDSNCDPDLHGGYWTPWLD